MNTVRLHVSGMHCQACERLAEMELQTAPGVKSVKASLREHAVEISGELEGKPAEQLARELQPFVQKHGYTLSAKAIRHSVKWREFAVAAPVAVGLMALFFFAQKLGVDKIAPSSTGYGMAFVIGLVASVSSCMAVVGGLVLSLSAFYAQRGERVRPQLQFHLGRLISFFVLGGVAGAAGSIFHLGAVATLILGLLVGLAMFMTGVVLLDVFPRARGWQVMLPRHFGDHVHRLKRHPGGAVSFALGAATFFLPCGFTQSMQLYTLSTGSFLAGALTMLSFALGTLPVLALLSFSALGTHGAARSGAFFKTAGLLVIFFGLYNILTSLVGYGLIPPIF